MNEQINMKMSQHSRVRRSKIQSKVNIDNPSSRESIDQRKEIKRIDSSE